MVSAIEINNRLVTCLGSTLLWPDGGWDQLQPARIDGWMDGRMDGWMDG